MTRPREVLRAALFDRLSASYRSRSPDGEVGIREIHDAVMRGLERLLNSRVWWPGDLDDFEEASRSLLKYGLPDLSTYSWSSKADSKTIVALIEQAVKTYEPRLVPRSVKVTALERNDKADFHIRLRIDGILRVEPFTERVSFDTEFALDSGAMRVTSSS